MLLAYLYFYVSKSHCVNYRRGDQVRERLAVLMIMLHSVSSVVSSVNEPSAPDSRDSQQHHIGNYPALAVSTRIPSSEFLTTSPRLPQARGVGTPDPYAPISPTSAVLPSATDKRLGLRGQKSGSAGPLTLLRNPNITAYELTELTGGLKTED
jgi:hypothetical protein